MKAMTTLLAGAAGLAAVAGTAGPAAAQDYPYGDDYGYGQNNGIGGVIDSVINPNRYGDNYGYRGNERFAVDRCARAAEDRVNRDYRWGGWNNRYGRARVVQITRVDRRGNGWKVWGVIDSGRGHGYGYGDRYGDRNGYSYGDLRFDCRVDYRGTVRDIDINHNNNLRS